MTSMYTVCPKCALTLAVTAGDLRVAQGHVRCGRCSHVFNALTRLTSDDRQEEPQLKLTGSDTLDEALPEGVFEFNADASKVFAEPLPAPKWTPTGTYRGSAARQPAAPNPNDTAEFGAFEIDLTSDALTSATLETPVLKATPEPPGPQRRTVPPRTTPPRTQAPRTAPPRPSVPPRPAPPRSVTRAPAPPQPATIPMPREATTAAPAATPIFPQQQPPVFPQQQAPVPISAGVWTPRRRRMPDPDESAPLQRPARDTTVSPRQALVVRQTQGPSAAAAAQVDALLAAHAAKEARAVAQSILTRSPGRNAQRYRWGAVALAALLGIQALNHYRNDLATNASLRGPLTTLYGIFGVHLVPRWDLTAYDVRRLGASTTALRGGQIMIRASIKNAGHQPQPMPLLRITLQDQFGNPLAARDVQPAAYLPVTRQSNGFMSAGERIDAEIAFADPGPKALNYTLDACLPAPEGGTACANQ